MVKNRNDFNSTNSHEDICLYLPPFVNSEGLWPNPNHPEWLFNSSLSVLLLQMLIIFTLYGFIHFLLKRFGVSRISSQIIGGFVLGYFWKKFDLENAEIFSVSSEDVLGLIAYLGYVMFLFLAAVKIDVTMITKTGKKSLMIGICVIVIPFVCRLLVAKSVDESSLSAKQFYSIPAFINIHTLSSFPVIASVLGELQIVHSELGRLCLSSALISELFSNALFLIGTLFDAFGEASLGGYLRVGSLILLAVLILFVFRPAMFWIVKQTREGESVKRSHLQAVVFLALLSYPICTWMSISAILGPYFLGLAVPDGAPLGSTLVDKLDCFVSDIFLPILAAICSLRVDPFKLFNNTSPFTKLNICIFFLILLIKIITCFLSALYCNLPIRDSLALALIMSCKGIVELVMYTLLKDYQVLDDDGLQAFFVIAVAVSAAIIPMAVKCLHDPSSNYIGYQSRNIMNLKQNSELRILACIHQNDNIPGIIHLLNLSSPSSENPLAVYVLHLMELIGRTTPIFISHRLQQNSLHDKSYSENVILSFDHFKRDNCGTVYVECFTAISPDMFLYDDICRLAMAKIVSIIILPFHRTWTIDGFVKHDDTVLRSLNNNMLDKAPCSMGIFVDQGHLGRAASKTSSSYRHKYSVCVLYLGGNDDREALTYAKRMANGERIELTVLRLKSEDRDIDGSSKSWDEMIDSEMIRDMKLKCTNVKYVEEVSNDGHQTAIIFRRIVSEFELIIVGRRSGVGSPQTTGLSDWSEFAELGAIGDLIVSIDNVQDKSSLLVVQQHMVKRS